MQPQCLQRSAAQPAAALGCRSQRRQCSVLLLSGRRAAQRAPAQQQRWVPTCSLNNTAGATVVKPVRLAERSTLRMGIPSKGRMAEDTIQLLKDCQLSVYKPNPRQYVAAIPQLPGLEVWFQRATDVVRKLMTGDIDIGIVGHDMLSEIGDDDPDLLILHDALGFGQCHLGLGVPMTGRFANVNTLDDLRAMGWSEANPLRVVTGYHNLARKFFAEKGFEHVVLLSADGALEAAPAMGSADIILDLISTGVTLRENNLKQLDGGKIMDSQGVLVANRRSLLERKGLLDISHELMERLEAHLTAEQFYSVIANMRGESAEEVSGRLLQNELLRGLQGPTVSPIYVLSEDGKSADHRYYAAVICVHKKKLYSAVKELRKVGGSGVLVQPMTYIFDEEPARWQVVLQQLGIDHWERPQ